MLRRTLSPLLVAAGLLAGLARAVPPRETLLGRWDLTVRGAEGAYPSWLEISEQGGRLTGRFVGRRGSARPLKRVVADGERLEFAVGDEDASSEQVFTGRLARGQLRGTTSEGGGALTWSAVRAPSLARSAPPRWGRPVTLFNGRDLTGWKSYPANAKSRWEAREGILFNAGSGAGLVTEREFEDFRLQLEFKIEPGSDSGVYLRGRYEIEIEDSYGKKPDSYLLGSIYGFLTPTSLPARRASEWQTIDATLVGRRVTVILNGVTVIDNVEIPGITGGALDSDEGRPGPLLLQGDYGPVSYRNITLTPALR